MKRFHTLATAILIAAGASMPAAAADFFSTAKPASMIDLGVHAGVTTSNRTMASGVFDLWNHNSWGTGITAGVNADIYFRDWISIQPGIFFESRSGNYAYSNTHTTATGLQQPYTQLGHARSYNLSIPVLASAHFNVTNNVRWNVELGPYFQIGLSNKFSGKAEFPSSDSTVDPDLLMTPETGYTTAKTKGFDFGIKFGTGLTILKHYNFSIHYEAGALNVWKDSALGGRNKAWTFTVGYLF